MKWGPVPEAEVLGKPSVPMGKGKRWCGVRLLGTKKSICVSHKYAGVGQRGEEANPRDQAQAYEPKTRPHFKK